MKALRSSAADQRAGRRTARSVTGRREHGGDERRQPAVKSAVAGSRGHRDCCRQRRSASLDEPVQDDGEREPETESRHASRAEQSERRRSPEPVPPRGPRDLRPGALEAPPFPEEGFTEQDEDRQADEGERKRTRCRSREADLKLGEDRSREGLILQVLEGAVLGEEGEADEQAAAEQRHARLPDADAEPDGQS